jgi:tetraacyldisaccharide 4'-kinase
MHRGATLAAWAEALLARHWWRGDRSWLALLLTPLSWLYRALAALQGWRIRPQAAPVPVWVVGNYVVGGAGKTPVVMALVKALQAAGHRPGVISRGHGRRSDAVLPVTLTADARDVGDEPLLIHLRTGAPVWVGRQRLRAAQALCAAHPDVTVLVCDDGLQHRALARDAELVVFDARGVGNGLLLPAGPMRQALPQRLAAQTRVLYAQGAVCSALPGFEITRSIHHAWPLQAWWDGDATQAVPLAALQGRPLLAVAGVAAPAAFFAMLGNAGLDIKGLALPDHSRYEQVPWPAGTLDVITTEKDAVKLRAAWATRPGSARVWVVPLDLHLPAALLRDLIRSLPPLPGQRRHTHHEP